MENEKNSMQKIINHLIQLQDLAIARAQQETLAPGTRLTQLEESIQTMLQELPPEVAEQFRKLQKKDHLAIVPISHQVCTACGMTLPISLAQAVRQAERLQYCPNCARILYHSGAAPRKSGPPRKRGSPVKAGVERFSSADLMIPRLEANSGEEAIGELCRKMEAEGFVDCAEHLIEEALKREAIASTAVDHGLAFSHVRGVEGGGLTLVLGLKKRGLKFEEAARSLTRIVFFMVIPTAASAFYLKLLAGLIQVFRKEENREKLFEAATPDELWKALARATRGAI